MKSKKNITNAPDSDIFPDGIGLFLVLSINESATLSVY
jgi:hypothetical protein